MLPPSDEKPIVSLLADDPVERPRIEAFVLALSEVVDGLQDLEQAGDFARVTAAAASLAADAERNGFPPLGEAARDVRAAADLRDGKHTRDALIELTEVARRVRLGHRGAAPPGF